MTDARQRELSVEAPPSEFMRRLGLLVVAMGAVAVIGAFIPVVTVVALVLGLAGLGLGILCLLLDKQFNVAALIGTLASSAAVSLAIIMGIVYGA